jgi:hypothetical protein
MWEDNVGMRLVKNNLHPLADTISWTGQSIRILTDPATQQAQAFQMFHDGTLDSVGVPSDRAQDYVGNPDVIITPDASTWAVHINMSGTVERQQEIWAGSTYVPEPILANTKFRQSLYYALNRSQVSEHDPRTMGTNTLFSDAYYVEPESGYSYRQTEQGQAVADSFYGDTLGYNFDLALSLFKEAVAEEIANGNYEAGTASNPTVIEIEVLDQDGLIGELWFAFLNEWWSKLVDDTNFVELQFTRVPLVFPQHYDRTLTGAYDMMVGSISGSALDAASFLDLYDSNAPLGELVLDRGHDTNVPEIEVSWTEQGVDYNATFSYNAIFALLNGNVLLKDGVVATSFYSIDELVEVEVAGLGENLSEVVDGEEVDALGQQVVEFETGMSYDDFVYESGVDLIHNVLVVTEEGTTRLLVISEFAGEFSVLISYDVLSSVEEALNYNAAVYGLTLVEYVVMESDEDMTADVADYLAGSYGVATYTDLYDLIWNNFLFNPENLIFAGAVWDDGTAPWADAFLILNVGEYFVPIYWL